MLKKFVTLVLGIMILLAAIPVARAETTYERYYDRNYETNLYGPVYKPVYGGGTHPWDSRQEMVRLRPRQIPVEVYYYSPFRSVTHALHPFFRNTYYTPAVPLTYRYERRRSQYFAPKLEEPTAGCTRFTYSRPNYRTPPYEYEC